MIKSVTITNKPGKIRTLYLNNPYLSGIVIKQITGLGPPKASINSTDLALGDGAVYNSARAGTRNIVFALELIDVTDEKGNVIKTIEEVRQDTYSLFPIKNKIHLSFQTDTRHAEIEGYVESNEPDIFNKKESTQISIICDRPYFYESNRASNLNGVTGSFEFPFSNELNDPEFEHTDAERHINFGNFSFDTSQAISYRGDINSGVIFNIHAAGPFGELVIVNNTSREIMHINTSKFKAITNSDVDDVILGDDIYISTQVGNKYATLVRDGVYYNILSCIPKDDDWIKLVNGDNIFTFDADFGATNASINIQSFILYTGI